MDPGAVLDLHPSSPWPAGPGDGSHSPDDSSVDGRYGGYRPPCRLHSKHVARSTGDDAVHVHRALDPPALVERCDGDALNPQRPQRVADLLRDLGLRLAVVPLQSLQRLQYLLDPVDQVLPSELRWCGLCELRLKLG